MLFLLLFAYFGLDRVHVERVVMQAKISESPLPHPCRLVTIRWWTPTISWVLSSTSVLCGEVFLCGLMCVHAIYMERHGNMESAVYHLWKFKAYYLTFYYVQKKVVLQCEGFSVIHSYNSNHWESQFNGTEMHYNNSNEHSLMTCICIYVVSP